MGNVMIEHLKPNKMRHKKPTKVYTNRELIDKRV